jgi:hypothetical protein
MALGSCSELVQYTQEISDSRSGRGPLVTIPANFGGFAGFVAGIPVDAVLLPVTYPVYQYQKSASPDDADPVSTMLFPSFFLWQTGKALGVPFDLLEFTFYRAWRSPETLTAGEREEIELLYDQDFLPPYPVEVIYPPAAGPARQ